MIEQETVSHEIQRSVFVQHPEVALHLFRFAERAPKLVHQVLLVPAQFVRILRINGRQVGVKQGEKLAVNGDGAVLIIDLVEQRTVAHMPFGVTEHGLSFQFELNDRDGFVHFSHQLRRACQSRVVLKILCLPKRARIVSINRHGEIGQRQEVDTVSFLQGFYIGIPYRDAQNRSQKRHVSRHRSHPFDVMVSPLDIVVADGRKDIKNLACSGSSIKNVSDDMQRVNCQRMNEIRDDNNQIFRASGFNNGIDNSIVIRLSVMLLKVRFVEQFSNDIFIPFRQEAVYFRTAVFDCDRPRDIHYLVQARAIPFFKGRQIRYL